MESVRRVLAMARAPSTSGQQHREVQGARGKVRHEQWQLLSITEKSQEKKFQVEMLRWV